MAEATARLRFEGRDDGAVTTAGQLTKEMRQMAKEMAKTTAKANPLRNAAARLRTSLSRLAKGAITRVQTGIAKVGRTLATGAVTIAKYGAAAATAALGGLAVMVNRSRETIDVLAKSSDTIGITTAAYAGLMHAANQTGVSNEELQKGFLRMSKTVGDAKAGLTTATDALEALELTYQDLEKMSPDEQFKTIAEQMAKVETQTDRVKLAYDLFGKSGTKLLNTMASGADGLEAYHKEAEILGLTLSRVAAKDVESFNDSLDRVQKIGTGFSQSMTVALAPALQYVTDSIFRFVERAGGMESITQKIVDIIIALGIRAGYLGTVFIEVGKWIWDAISPLRELFGNVYDWFHDNIGKIIATAADWSNKILGILTGWIPAFLRAIGDAFSWVADKIGAVVEFFGGEEIAAGISSFGNDVESFIDGMASGVDSFNSARDTFLENLKDTGEQIDAGEYTFKFGELPSYEEYAANARAAIEEIKESNKEAVEEMADTGDAAQRTLGVITKETKEKVEETKEVVEEVVGLWEQAFLDIRELALTSLGSVISSALEGDSDAIRAAVQKLGADIGNELGAAVGTSLGGAVGGAVGGALGQFVGSKVGDVVNAIAKRFDDAFFSGKDRVSVGVNVGSQVFEQLRASETQTGASGLALTAYSRGAGDEGREAARDLLDTFLQIDRNLISLFDRLGQTIDLSGTALTPGTAGTKLRPNERHDIFGSVEYDMVDPESIRTAADRFVKAWIDAAVAQIEDVDLKNQLQGLAGPVDEILAKLGEIVQADIDALNSIAAVQEAQLAGIDAQIQASVELRTAYDELTLAIGDTTAQFSDRIREATGLLVDELAEVVPSVQEIMGSLDEAIAGADGIGQLTTLFEKTVTDISANFQQEFDALTASRDQSVANATATYDAAVASIEQATDALHDQIAANALLIESIEEIAASINAMTESSIDQIRESSGLFADIVPNAQEMRASMEDLLQELAGMTEAVDPDALRQTAESANQAALDLFDQQAGVIQDRQKDISGTITSLMTDFEEQFSWSIDAALGDLAGFFATQDWGALGGDLPTTTQAAHDMLSQYETLLAEQSALETQMGQLVEKFTGVFDEINAKVKAITDTQLEAAKTQAAELKAQEEALIQKRVDAEAAFVQALSDIETKFNDQVAQLGQKYIDILADAETKFKDAISTTYDDVLARENELFTERETAQDALNATLAAIAELQGEAAATQNTAATTQLQAAGEMQSAAGQMANSASSLDDAASTLATAAADAQNSSNDADLAAALERLADVLESLPTGGATEITGGGGNTGY